MMVKKNNRNRLRLYECHHRYADGKLVLIACLATSRKEAEMKIHEPKWWEKKGIRSVEEFR